MTISYTDNFNFPLHQDGGNNWGAIINGALIDIDTELSREIVTYNNTVQVKDGFVQKLRNKD